MGPPHSASSKVQFSVCYRSGEDKQHPASELNYHSPRTLGWQTEEFCDYPQVKSDESGNKNLNFGNEGFGDVVLWELSGSVIGGVWLVYGFDDDL